MAATLQLVRARRSVMVIDAGLRRNHTASHSYGFLGQDSVDPAESARTAKTQLEAYPTLTWKVGDVAAATGANDAFQVTLATGESFAARRLLFATGVTDELPHVSGLAERWGQSVFHCPYCHGYELDQGHSGVIETGPRSLHQAQLLTDWGKITFLTNATFSMDDDVRADLDRRGITTEETPIDRIEREADVIPTDGRHLRFAGSKNCPFADCARRSSGMREVGEVLRALISEVRMVPEASARNGHTIELIGELAGILRLGGLDTTKPPRFARALSETMVAGVGFEPTTFRL